MKLRGHVQVEVGCVVGTTGAQKLMRRILARDFSSRLIWLLVRTNMYLHRDSCEVYYHAVQEHVFCEK